MKRTLIALSVAALSAAGSAQASLVSPDPSYALGEGQGFTTRFGQYSSGRYQLADGNQRGGTATLSEVSFRHDHRNYDVTTGMGRAWAGVTIHMSEGDLPTFNATFSTNSLTLPTQVFSSPVTWPVRLGPTDPLPDSFRLRFPFSTNWAYSGNREIVTDIRFDGGTLANSAGWSGSTAHSYYLDSFFVGSFASGPAVSLGHTNGGCVDSGYGPTQAATMRLDMTTYGPNMASTVFRNKYAVLATGENFNPSSIMMLAMAFLADTSGVNVGIPCNQIHLNLTRKWFFYPQTTDAVGKVPPFAFGLPSGLTTYNPAWIGFNLVIQGAWTDSVTGLLKLSSASRNSFVSLPMASSAAVRMKAAFDHDASRTSALLTADGDSTSIPIICYKK